MTKKNYLVTVFVGCMFALFFNACSKSNDNPTPPDGSNTKTINITGTFFPASITVAKGTTVIWKNDDAMAHTVTSDDGNTFSSGNLALKASFKYKASTAGTFAYHCEYHANMTGSLVVTP